MLAVRRNVSTRTAVVGRKPRSGVADTSDKFQKLVSVSDVMHPSSLSPRPGVEHVTRGAGGLSVCVCREGELPPLCTCSLAAGARAARGPIVVTCTVTSLDDVSAAR